jgi:hypothetical protein
MPFTDELAQLSRLATTGFSGEASVDRSLEIVRHALDADHVTFAYGRAMEFGQLNTEGAPKLSDIALWVINRELTSHPGPCAFDVNGHRIVQLRPADARGCEHIAALVPTPGTNAQMLVAHGSWPGGLPRDGLAFIEAALPALAVLLSHQLDLARGQHESQQLSALMQIGRMMSGRRTSRRSSRRSP